VTSVQRKFFRQLRRMGLQVVVRSGHCKVLDADGNYLLTTSGTPKCPENQINELRRDLRRYHGIEVP